MAGWQRVVTRWARAIALGLVVAVCATGCSDVSDPQPWASSSGAREAAGWPEPGSPFGDPRPEAWWAAADDLGLVPTAADLVARTALTDLVVDATGAVWMQGGWRVVRVDPASGTAREWDLGDDPAFAAVVAVGPAQQAGVWLLSSDRLRLFDGERFVRDLEVPAELSGGLGEQIPHVVDVGSEVWVSSSAGVHRLANGIWTRRAPGELATVAALTVDGSGGVWAHASPTGSSQSASVVGTFDPAGRWEVATGAPRRVDEVLGLPGAGVLVRTAGDLAAFDGTAWTPLPPLRLDIGGPLARGAAVTTDGAVWVKGARGMARLAPDGPWQLFRGSSERPLQAIVASGESVLALTGSSLLRYDSDGSVEPLWQDEDPAMVATPEGVADWIHWPDDRPTPGDRLRPRHVVAVSATEAWVAPQLYPRPFRLVDGRWRELPVVPLAADSALTLASDGAVWALTVGGLVRIPAGGRPQELAPFAGSQVHAGADGSVWVVPEMWYGWWYLSAPNPQGYVAGPSLVNVRTDGERTAVPLPAPAWTLTSVVTGVEGSIWATHCSDGGRDPCPSGSHLRWWKGGRWTSVGYPGQDITALAVSARGALWARLRPTPGADPELARYDQGTWSRWSDLGPIGSVATGPDGSLCTITPQPELACVDPSGATTRREIPVTGRMSIASDGSLWVVGEGGVAVLRRAAG